MILEDGSTVEEFPDGSIQIWSSNSFWFISKAVRESLENSPEIITNWDNPKTFHGIPIVFEETLD